MKPYFLFIISLTLLSSSLVRAQDSMCLSGWTYLASQGICYWLSGQSSKGTLSEARSQCESYDAPNAILALEENAVDIVADIDDTSPFTGCYRLEGYQKKDMGAWEWYENNPDKQKLTPGMAVNDLRPTKANLCIKPQEGSYYGDITKEDSNPYICQSDSILVPTTTQAPTTTQEMSTKASDCDDENDGWWLVENEGVCVKMFNSPKSGFWNAWEECKSKNPPATLLEVKKVLKVFAQAQSMASEYRGRLRINGHQKENKNGKVFWRIAEGNKIRRPMASLIGSYMHSKFKGTLTINLNKMTWYGDNNVSDKLGFICQRSPK